MKPDELRTSINEIETDFTSSTRSIEAQVEKLRSELNALKSCIEQKNKEIEDLKREQAEYAPLFEKVKAMFDRQPQQKLLNELRDMESEVKSLVGMAASSEKAVESSTSFVSSASTSNDLSGWNKDERKSEDDSAAFGAMSIRSRIKAFSKDWEKTESGEADDNEQASSSAVS